MQIACPNHYTFPSDLVLLLACFLTLLTMKTDKSTLYNQKLQHYPSLSWNHFPQRRVWYDSMQTHTQGEEATIMRVDV